MKKKLIILLIFALAAATPSYAVDLQKMMRDSLGRGYLEASQGNRIQSKKYFRKAFDLGRKTRDWSVMIDAAGGLLALGEREDAVECFDKVAKMNTKTKDWRASIALAYNHLSFPKDFVDKGKIEQSLADAEKYASEKKDWRGLVEGAKAFYESGSKDCALECLDIAKNIGSEGRNYEVMAEIAYYYKKFGEPQKSQEAVKLCGEYRADTEKPLAYPENFKPYGETVASPKKIGADIQTAERESADAEIASKMDYLAKREALSRQEKEYYLAYNDYYGYPYYQRFYANYGSAVYLPPDWLGEWANYHLRCYNLVDGNYVFMGW